MIKVCGTWEFAYDTPIKEHEQWCYALEDFGVDEWIMWPKTGIKSSRVTEYDSLEDALDANPELTPVILSEKGEIESMEFVQPKDVIYILGKASYDPLGTYIAGTKDIKSVKIGTPYGRGGMWGHQAILLRLRDEQWLSQ